MRYYYLNQQNQPVGPVSTDELKKLLAIGDISNSTSVAPVGSQEWTPLASLPELQAGTPSPAASADTDYAVVLPKLVALCLTKIRGLLNAQLASKALAMAQKAGHWVVLASAVLTLLLALIQSIRWSSPLVFFLGIGAVLVIGVLHYVAVRFLKACEKLNENTPSMLSSSAVPDCLGLALSLWACVLLIGGLVASVGMRSPVPLFVGIFAAIGTLVIASLSLNPNLLKISIAPSSAGEEAVGLLSFFAKLPFTALPLCYFLCLVSGAFISLAAMFGNNLDLMSYLPYSAHSRIGDFDGFGSDMPRGGGVFGGLGGVPCTITALLMPAAFYAFFLFSYLLVDILRVILALPTKFDAQKK